MLVLAKDTKDMASMSFIWITRKHLTWFHTNNLLKNWRVTDCIP